MNYPSEEFDGAVAALCDGAGDDGEVGRLHALLQADPAARDEYLWQVELHASLALIAATRPEVESVVYEEQSRTGRRIRWAVAALLAIAVGVAVWSIRTSPRDRRNLATPSTVPAEVDMSGGSSHTAGIYRATVGFAIAADAPVIVGTGKSESIRLGAEVPYAQGGDTLHVWDWSKSPESRVMKDVRLWPEDVIAVSPDGESLVWAGGKILNLATGEPSSIDLGGELYLDHAGGQMRRIQRLQFTPDGRHLALLLSNVVLKPSTHPLRKQDFGTVRTIQIVSYPKGERICEFSAGQCLAFTMDGTRAATALPEDEAGQRIVEHSAATGDILRRYEPPLREFAQAIAWSADGKRLAAFDSAGEVLIWDATTGGLTHRIAMKERSPADLRFSPDGRLLAISLLGRTSVIDVAGGAIVAAAPQELPGLIRWTADGRAFDVIANVHNVSMSERQDAAGRTMLFNCFPALTHWKLDDIRTK